ncbi:MAG TPA: potassium-transporting ATPase subunit F [Acidimicrobiales bacterium]|nr:potassium-transporting ATPase subunit F [Acidimicrobiales bacterium]
MFVLASSLVSLGDNLFALALVVALLGYLVLVLVFPERF